jgi:hypothetical protein
MLLPPDCEVWAASRVPGKATRNPAPIAERLPRSTRPAEKVKIPFTTDGHAGAEFGGASLRAKPIFGEDVQNCAGNRVARCSLRHAVTRSAVIFFAGFVVPCHVGNFPGRL